MRTSLRIAWSKHQKASASFSSRIIIGEQISFIPANTYNPSKLLQNGICTSEELPFDKRKLGWYALNFFKGDALWTTHFILNILSCFKKWGEKEERKKKLALHVTNFTIYPSINCKNVPKFCLIIFIFIKYKSSICANYIQTWKPNSIAWVKHNL